MKIINNLLLTTGLTGQEIASALFHLPIAPASQPER